MIRVYGVPGCGPCEVAKLFFTSRRVPFTFIDVTGSPEKRLELRERLGSETGGVILEDGHTLTAMPAVSIASLNRYLAQYESRAQKG